MVRYSGQISDKLRKHYKKDPLTVMRKNKNLNYSKDTIKKMGLNKTKSVPSAVHIAAAIASYARLTINEYKNIPGNPCIMSDTDSVVLTKPLPDNLIGDELGQLKLVHIIKEGIFIKKKLYYLKTSDNQEIIKSSGIDPTRLNYEHFIKLFNGESITIERTNFKVDWKGLNIEVVNSDIIVQGLTNILEIESKIDDVLSIETKNKHTSSIGYSYFEITTLFIFLFSFFIIFGLFLYKIY